MFKTVPKEIALNVLDQVRESLVKNINREEPRHQFICIAITSTYFKNVDHRHAMVREIDDMLGPFACLEQWMRHYHLDRYAKATRRDMLTARLQWVEWMIEQVKARAD